MDPWFDVSLTLKNAGPPPFRSISVNFRPLHFDLDFSKFQLKDCRPLRSLQSSTDSCCSILVVWLARDLKL